MELEREIQFQRTSGGRFRAPKRIAGLRRIGSVRQEIVDTHLDCPERGLLAVGASVRIRRRPDRAITLATFKGPRVDRPDGIRERTELEVVIESGADLSDEDAIQEIAAGEVGAALRALGINAKALGVIGVIRNRRMAHRYRGPEGEIELACDALTFHAHGADDRIGRRERRLEIELVHGRRGLLRRAAREIVRRRGADVCAPRRGKRRELHRRILAHAGASA